MKQQSLHPQMPNAEYISNKSLQILSEADQIKYIQLSQFLSTSPPPQKKKIIISILIPLWIPWWMLAMGLIGVSLLRYLGGLKQVHCWNQGLFVIFTTNYFKKSIKDLAGGGLKHQPTAPWGETPMMKLQL